MLVPLKDIIEILDPKGEELKRLLSSFRCSLDPDIEYFLRKKASEYESLAKARTYLVLDEEELRKKPFEEWTVQGYVAIALKVLTVPAETSNRKRKELDGLSAKIHGEQIDTFPVYLIGQLGRNTDIPKDRLSGEELLQHAYRVLLPAVEAVGGRYILVECHPEQKLIDFYKSNDFEVISQEPDGEKPMVQLIRKI